MPVVKMDVPAELAPYFQKMLEKVRTIPTSPSFFGSVQMTLNYQRSQITHGVVTDSQTIKLEQ